jgi:HK97 family phage major capsid protein
MADDNVTTASTRDTAILAAEKERTTELARIAREHGQHERLADWISNGVSTKAASDEVMATYRAKMTAPIQNAEPVVTGYKEREEDKPYNSMGEFLRDVVIAGRAGGMMAPQLRSLRAASGQGEAMPADGGFALQPAFATEIQRVMYGGGNILSRVKKLPVGPNANSAKILALKENSRANGSRLGGITSAYADEGDTISTSKASHRTVELNLRKLVAAVPTSDELLQDTMLMDALIREIVPEELRFRVEDAIINGTGAGQALGVINSPALVTQAIEGSQTIANTNQYIWFNVAKMYTRMLPGSLKNAVWFIQQALWAKILTATAGTGNPAAPIFAPPGSLSQTPFGTIYGIPVIPIEQAAAEGTVGDIILADMSQYLFIDKGGVNAAQSIHVRFLQDESVLRWTYRFDGSPAINSPVTPYTGSNTLSAFVALAARS